MQLSTNSLVRRLEARPYVGDDGGLLELLLFWLVWAKSVCFCVSLSSEMTFALLPFGPFF